MLIDKMVGYMKYRLALDLGSNSLGWAIYLLTEQNLIKELFNAGVRIFPDGRDPQSKESLAVARRGPRSARRRRDRYLQRRQFLMAELIKYGLMPPTEEARKELEKLDPYFLRKQALDEKINLGHFGRILFHLNQRRGFQSNRIADRGKDIDSGKVKEANKRLIDTLKENGFRTYGEFLAARHTGKVREREPVRIRLHGIGAKALYDFYPTRDIYKQEFNALWEAQRNFHPGLNEELQKRFFEIIFFQRPLKKPAVGKCTFFPDEERLPKAHPLSQERRIYQDLNHLKLKIGLDAPRNLSMLERDKLAFVLMSGEDVTLKTGLRKILKDLPASTTTSLEEGGKADRLVGNLLAARLSGKKGPLKDIWSSLSIDQRADIALKINEEPDESKLISYLKETYKLSEETAKATANLTLPDGHDSLGYTATKKILEELKKEVVTYNVAVERGLGLHHSDFRDGEIFDQLPFYGEVLQGHTLGGTGDPNDNPEKRYGKIANPTVHVALNQIKRVVNAIMDKYGNPEQIVIELARDIKLSQKQKAELDKVQKQNEDKNKTRETQINDAGFEKNSSNLRLMRLWEELGDATNRRCVYSGRIISLSDLFSDEVEVEHILPYSRTLDDTMANKTLCYREFNRGKHKQTPSEAYKGAEYQDIRLRAQILPPNKRWRFEPNAMEEFEKNHRDFAARQLNDTRHLGKIAKKYLSKAADPDNVWVITGQLTSMVRGALGLNSILSDHNQKNRTDHRHHAIDAIVIGLIDRALVQFIAKQAENLEDKEYVDNILKDIVREIHKKFPNFRTRVEELRDRMVVSHKKDHGTGGALHNESNYGINNGSDRDLGELITRKAIEALSPNEIDKVRDIDIRKKLIELRAEVAQLDLKDAEYKKELAKALKQFGDENRIRRVRILKKQEDFITIKDKKTGKPYRAVIPGENHHMDIIETKDGKWIGIAETVFEVNNSKTPKWKNLYPEAKFIMRVHKGDMLELDDTDGVRRIKKIVRLSPSNNILYLVNHNEGGDFAKRHSDKNDSFQWDFANISKLASRNCVFYK